MTQIGEVALWLALLVAGWGAALGFYGGRRGRGDLVLSAERSMFAMFWNSAWVWRLSAVLGAKTRLRSAALSFSFAVTSWGMTTSGTPEANTAFVAFGSAVVFAPLMTTRRTEAR